MVMRRLFLIVCTLALAACAGPATTPTPPPSVRPFPSLPPLVTPVPASEEPVFATPTPAITPCALSSQAVDVASDNLINTTFAVGPSDDTVSFVFDPGSKPRPQGPAKLELSETTPPFYKGESSETIDILGARYLLLRFSGMTVESYTGATTLDTADTSDALRQVVLTDASEGILTFVVGFDSLSCPNLTTSAERIDLVLPH